MFYHTQASAIVQQAQQKQETAAPKKTFNVGFDYAHEDDVLPKKMVCVTAIVKETLCTERLRHNVSQLQPSRT